MSPDIEEIAERIVRIETQLESLIGSIDKLVTKFEDHQEALYDLLNGENNQPGLVNRVFSLERTEKTLKWALGVVYAALVATIIKLFGERI